jgi:magnesium chelatase family protein
MQAVAYTVSLFGLDAFPIRVEVDSSRGVANYTMVGLAEASVRESRVRVRAALSCLGIDLQEYVLTINLAPADVRKSGGAFDLAIAVATLAALGRVPLEALDRLVLLGELSLGGEIRSVRGVMPALRGLASRGFRRAIVPRINAAEASLVPALDVCVASTLEEVLRHLEGGASLDRPATVSRDEPPPVSDFDLADVRGQAGARRALEIAAAGAHNLLFVGPPGSGKTMLAQRLPTILPPLSFEEALEVTAVHSVAGMLSRDRGILRERPYRAPHHSVSAAGLVGGGDPIRPGEVSLAHQGCLFLDELLEFKRHVLESLRQPLEEGWVSVARARGRVRFPARPMVVAAVNPCPCGYQNDRPGRCRCSVERIRQYRAKLSGPLLDRLDLQVAIPAVEVAKLSSFAPGESSASVRERVLAAREIQAARRERGEVVASTNAALSVRDLDRIGAPDAAGLSLLESAAERLGLSARAFGKVLRVGRTIADLESSHGVRARHVAEAIGLRLLDRELSPSAFIASA